MGDGQEMNFMLEYLTEHWNTALGIVAAFISVLGAVFSRIDARDRRRQGQEQLRQNASSAYRIWGEAVIDAMSEGAALACMRNMDSLAFYDQRERCATTLSALIDRGRLFFPNVADVHASKDKEMAFRGKRPPILDAIIYAFYEVEALTPNDNHGAREYIVMCRRFFVSELQVILDPHRLRAILADSDTMPDSVKPESIHSAGELGVILNSRRPGILTQKKDNGWISAISPQRRAEILMEYGEDVQDTPNDRILGKDDDK